MSVKYVLVAGSLKIKLKVVYQLPSSGPSNKVFLLLVQILPTSGNKA